MAEQGRCEHCGSELNSGLCPKCLLRNAIEHGAGKILSPLLPKLRYFGDYELQEEIAHGGMGVVYRAKQVSLDRTVAVKMMRPGLLATEREIERFRTEARMAASLQHPNIVAIHEIGEFDGLHYFSMDFVEGPNLAELVRKKPLSPAEAARYVQILAEAVEYAHSRGVLHRDLKPSNVLVDALGQPRITDFGLARPIEGEGTTSAGTIVGTPAYMPPEQASGGSGRPSPASDVYSLGAILYELLTGLPPFRGASQIEVVRKVVDEAPVRPSVVNAQVGRDLEAICLRCLEKDPGRRYGSAGELARDLASFQRNEPTAAGAERRWRYVLPIAAVLAIVFMVAVVTTRRQPPARRPYASVTTTTPRIEPSAPGVMVKRNPPKAVRKVAKKAETPPTTPLPVGVDIAPMNGTGYNETFRFRYRGATSASDIGMVEIHFQDPARSCTIFAEPQSGRVSLQFQPERGPSLRVSGDAGSLTRLDNSICTIDLSSAYFKVQGNDVEAALLVTFKSSFDGPKEVVTWPWNAGRAKRAPVGLMGHWTVGSGK